MDKGRQGRTGKVPHLVSIQPIRWLPEKEAQLQQAARDLIECFGQFATGGVIVGVNLDEITHAGDVMAVTMTINIRIPE